MNFYGDIRIGLIFEELDAFAGQIAYHHSNGLSASPPLTIVTASVDRIDMLGIFLCYLLVFFFVPFSFLVVVFISPLCE